MSVQETPSSALLIHNFPNVLSEEDVKEFLNHFGSIEASTGATETKSGRNVHARFPSTSAATAALIRLHQLNILGNCLKVEYTTTGSDGSVILGADSSFSTNKKKKHEPDRGTLLQEAFLKSLTSWTSSLDLNCAPPNHLRYQYPPPNARTLKNICEALRENPRLYTQLLHLMNRMNLPPPFEDEIAYEQATQTEEQWFISDSTEESEYESDEEADKESRGLKRPASQQPRGPQKNPLIKRPRVTLPCVAPVTVRTTPVVRPEEVFEKPEVEVTQKRIELKLTSNVSVSTAARVEEPTGGVGSFGLIYPAKDTQTDKEEEAEEDKDSADDTAGVITAEQLAGNRLSGKDLKVLPLFKNYQPGAPSCRLYIKNLSKKVESKDLHFIYRRYLQMATPSSSAMFDVRLMTEGRMKEQAFVTLPTKELAQKALQETNGYVLKDKPLCVQFARSAPTNNPTS